MYPTVCPPHGRVMIVQWENECISLPVLSVARVMRAQWDIALSVLSVARVQFPALVITIQGIFPWLITLCQPVLSVAENGSISPR